MRLPLYAFIGFGLLAGLPAWACMAEEARESHPVGVVELFMVPLGPGPDGFRYEVILT